MPLTHADLVLESLVDRGNVPGVKFESEQEILRNSWVCWANVIARAGIDGLWVPRLSQPVSH